MRRSGDGEQHARLAIEATIGEVFEAMHTRDAQRLRELFTPETLVINTDEREGPDFVRIRTLEEFVRAVAASPQLLSERIADSEVRVDADVAMVWAPYQFYIDDRFSHCGHDALQLLRTHGAWRITAFVYTISRAKNPALCPSASAFGSK